jgi:hypothetical protein
MEFFEITHLLQSPVSIIRAKTDTALYLYVLVCLDGLDTRCGSPGLVRDLMFAVPLWSPDKYGDGIRYLLSKDRRLGVVTQ